MIPVTQDVFHDPEGDTKGNCFAACVASILELPMHAVPNFVEREDWFHAVQEFLGRFGLFLAWNVEPTYREFWGYHVVSGPGPRGVRHSVVGYGLDVIWDPHPSRDGLVEADDWSFALLCPKSLAVIRVPCGDSSAPVTT